MRRVKKGSIPVTCFNQITKRYMAKDPDHPIFNEGYIKVVGSSRDYPVKEMNSKKPRFEDLSYADREKLRGSEEDVVVLAQSNEDKEELVVPVDVKETFTLQEEDGPGFHEMKDILKGWGVEFTRYAKKDEITALYEANINEHISPASTEG